MTEDRLKGFVIEVLSDRNTHQCASVAGQLKKAETRRISCMRGAIGNIIKVRMTSTRPSILTLCEFEVFGIRGKENVENVNKTARHCSKHSDAYNIMVS